MHKIVTVNNNYLTSILRANFGYTHTHTHQSLGYTSWCQPLWLKVSPSPCFQGVHSVGGRDPQSGHIQSSMRSAWDRGFYQVWGVVSRRHLIQCGGARANLGASERFSRRWMFCDRSWRISKIWPGEESWDKCSKWRENNSRWGSLGLDLIHLFITCYASSTLHKVKHWCLKHCHNWIEV